jgi:ArsR family transcriptional regulator, arsenate/arsenite/antimonite-responsive transcriptional repressor
MQIRDLNQVFRALSDETRLRIIKLLLIRELCVCEIEQALDISQPRASRHLGILEDAGLLRSRRGGAWVHYSIADLQGEASIREILGAIACTVNNDPEILEDLQRLGTAVRIGARGESACCESGIVEERMTS